MDPFLHNESKGVPPGNTNIQHVKMSDTRDFSALKGEEGWSTVRHRKENPRLPKMFTPQRQPTRPRMEDPRVVREEAEKKAREERHRQAELNEVNFPSLASAFEATVPRPSAWAKSGKELATAWRTADEEHETQQRADAYARQQAEERERREAERYFHLPRFRPSVRNDEDTYYEDDEEPPCNGGAGYAPPLQDDWERVQKKAKPRRPKNTMEQDEDEPPTVWDIDPDLDYVGDFDWSARPGRRNNDSLY